jgi:DNA-directed RNA polymerase subunit RPC12/RpoP
VKVENRKYVSLKYCGHCGRWLIETKLWIGANGAFRCLKCGHQVRLRPRLAKFAEHYRGVR